MLTLNVQDPTDPTLESAFYVGGNPTGIRVSGNEVFLVDLSSDLYMIDISNPSSPFLIDSIATDGEPNDVAVGHNFAYIADGDVGVQIVRTRHLGDPIALDVLNRDSDEIMVHGDFLYSLYYDRGIEVLDISDPGHPIFSASRNIHASALDIQGDVLYVAGTTPNEIHAFDIATPTFPDPLGTPVPTTDLIHDFDVDGDRLYVITAADDLRVYDVSDPANIPTPPAFFSLGSTTSHQLKVVGGRAYITTSSLNTLRILDVENLSNISQLSSVALDDDPTGLEVMGHYALVTQGVEGLKIFDVSDPASPSIVTTHSVGGATYRGVSVDGNIAVVTTNTQAVVFTLANPASPGFYGLVFLERGLGGAFSGGMFYVAQHSNGIKPVIVSQPFFDTYGNQGGSLVFHSGTGDIRKIKLTAAKTDSVGVSVHWNHGGSQHIPMDGTWISAQDVPGGTTCVFWI
jgi:hypothetical protein